MPRLSNTEYLRRHETLRRVWLKDKRYFSFLTINQQRYLQTHFLPYRDGSDAELLAHREHVTAHDPSLPRRASRALLVFYRRPAPQQPVPKVKVRPVMKPDIDITKIAMAVLDIIEHMPSKERAKLAKEGKEMREKRERERAA